MSILVLSVMLIGPLALGLLSARRNNVTGKQQSTDYKFACRAPWALIVNSAVIYALAYNLTFLLQELFLVIPKAIYGLQPILYHNNHRWLISDPIEDLLQGSGALAVLVSGLLFCWVLSRLSLPWLDCWRHFDSGWLPAFLFFTKRDCSLKNTRS